MVRGLEKIRKWRLKRKRYTLSEASNVLGFAVSYLSDIENGKRDFTVPLIQAYLDADPRFFRASDFFKQKPTGKTQAK